MDTLPLEQKHGAKHNKDCGQCRNLAFADAATVWLITGYILPVFALNIAGVVQPFETHMPFLFTSCIVSLIILIPLWPQIIPHISRAHGRAHDELRGNYLAAKKALNEFKKDKRL